jgi:hypothetical protein
MKSVGSAELPLELAGSVGSWFCGWKVAPSAGALMFEWRSTPLDLEPT